MFKNAVREARADALENACQFLRTLMKDMGHNEPENVEYTVVPLTQENYKQIKYMARVETPLRVDYGEPQATKLEAKQSAAYAAVLYMCRAKQFGRNFIAMEAQQSLKDSTDEVVADSSTDTTLRRRSDYHEEVERKRAYTTGAANNDHQEMAKRIFKEEEEKRRKKDEEDALPRVALSLDTYSRDNLDILLDKYLDNEKKPAKKNENKLERSMSLESGKFIAEINWAKKVKKKRNNIENLYF